MKYIQDLKEGNSVNDIYLCRKKQSLVTRNGKAYDALTLQDKTGALDAKIWDPGSMGIDDYEELDYVEVHGDITVFQGKLQLNVRRLRVCRDGEYAPENYLPVSSKDNGEMFAKLMHYIESVKNPDLHELLQRFFVQDTEFVKAFRLSSAAKSVHHGFVGGLLEHTLSVTELCDFYSKAYPILNRDLLITAAVLHDIGKTKELSRFPKNDYTDAGQLIGHIIIGTEMIGEKIREIDGFSQVMSDQLRHCILAHHGELEYGSPKKPALIEAAALNFADNTDAKLEIFKEALQGTDSKEWLGWQNFLDSNIRRTIE
ncbi:MAG: HD domain-containing protein [Lachnospiraceae bacterium]|nr:HD domain-containing protein [Lachnospiraceae bacterium]